MTDKDDHRLSRTGTRPVQWFESLQFRLTVGLLVILGILILAFMTVNQTLLRSVLIENNFDLVEQAGNSLVTELGQQIEATESLTRSIAGLGERLPFEENLYRRIVPHLMKTEGDEEIIAGGGIWPEPYAFNPAKERRSFFWARKFGDELKYYDDYNAPQGLGYHAEEWYVPAKYIGRDRCFWSKSYMDPYSLEPMVTCSVPMHKSDELVGVATVDVKLAGLQQFFASRAEKLGGYAFAVDRNNKFLSYPAIEMVRESRIPGEQSDTREYVTVRDFTSNNPQFKPIAKELQRFSDQLLDLARQQPSFDPGLSELIANESYQINRHEAQMITATFVDPLSPGNSPDSSLFETSVRFSMEEDLILGEPVLVSMFIMPKVYWKIVVVTPQRPVIDRASEVTGKILYVLITIILVSMIGAFIWLRRVLVRPLVSMTDEIREAPLLGLNIKTARDTGFTEIDLLGSTINRMRDQLSNSFKELRESENRFRLIAESLPEGLVIARRSDGVILYLNSRLREMFAIPEELDYSRLKFLDFYSDPKDRAHLLTKLQTSPVVSDYVVRARRYDDSSFWMSVSTSAVIFGGEDALVTGVIDVTKRKQAEDEVTLYRTHLEQMVEERTAELDGARRVALQAAAAKQNFLANMSHEIRTPLNAIVGIGHLLLMKEHLPTQNRYLLNLNKAGKILLKIINDILDITKMDMGKLKAEAVEFDLDDVLDDLSIHIRPQLADKGIDAYILRPRHLNLRLIGDPLKLQQVLLNLMTNAIKFTHQGHVICAVTKTDIKEGNAELEFEVRDTGIGIARDKMDSIFDAFTQADSATTREYGGTGLGLAISKTLVNLMGGRIQVESQQGKGSCFKFNVKLGLSDITSAPALLLPDGSDSQPVKALIASDNIREIESLECQLEGMEVASVALPFDTGILGALGEAADNSQPYHVLLLDWDQPERLKDAILSGLAEPGLTDNLAVIALTRNISDADERLLDRGILDAMISKPIRTSRLRSSISTFLNLDSDTSDSLTSPQLSRPLQKVRILLVEDNEQNQFVVEELLGDAGAHITIASNGRHALDLLQDRGADQFDIVLMDLHMPVMDGFEATSQIRRDYGPDELPVIALTAEVFKEVIEKCQNYGMNDYLAKPMNPIHAIKIISQWAQKSSQSGETATSPETQPSLPNVSETSFSQISLQRGLSNLDGKSQLYEKLLSDYRLKYAGFADELTRLLDQQQLEEAGRYVHTFCGLSGTIGAADIEKLARQLRRLLKSAGSDGNSEEVTEKLDQLSAELSELLEEIDSILASNLLKDVS